MHIDKKRHKHIKKQVVPQWALLENIDGYQKAITEALESVTSLEDNVGDPNDHIVETIRKDQNSTNLVCKQKH